MYGLKDKVSEQLSRLLADSSPCTTAPSSPVSQPHTPEARHYSKTGKSLFSLVSYVLPSVGSDNSDSQKHQPYLEPAQSPVKLVCERKFGKLCSPRHETSPREDPSTRSSTDSDEFEEAINETPRKLLPNLANDSAFISLELYDFLESSIPNIVKGRQWVLGSTLKDGISLRTLIRKSSDLPGPCVLIAGDKQGAVFGGMLECPLRPTSKRKYQGTNQTFVFTTIYGAPKLFRPTGANRFFCLCMNDLLALGGGGNFALRLNEDLLSGSSGASDTFGNSNLAHSSEFELKNVELWGFTQLSRYLR
ncbi:hypothetical protein ACFE04_013857 [Oxalis oulophora]